MGIYLNPGNSGFQRIVNSEYVDKTGLIGLVNQVMDTVDNSVKSIHNYIGHIRH